MNKNEILALMKIQILALKDHSKDLDYDLEYRKKWLKRHDTLKESLKDVNSCDAIWLEDEYCKWFKQEILPHLQLKSIPISPKKIDR